LAQVQSWRDHVLTRDILDHRAQLALLRTELHAQRRYLDDDLSCLDQMLREADAILRNTLAAPGGAEPPPARPEARARRALQ
jgi:hypothetical protein